MKKSNLFILICILIILSTMLLSSCNKNYIVMENLNSDINMEYIYTIYDIKNEPVYVVDDLWLDNGLYFEKNNIFMYKESDLWIDNDTLDSSGNYSIDKKSIITDSIILRDAENAKKIINNFPSNFNFKKYTLIVCIFGVVFDNKNAKQTPKGYEYFLSNVNLDDGKLIFTISYYDGSYRNGLNRQEQIIKIIKIKETNIKEVQFNVEQKFKC